MTVKTHKSILETYGRIRADGNGWYLQVPNPITFLSYHAPNDTTSMAHELSDRMWVAVVKITEEDNENR